MKTITVKVLLATAVAVGALSAAPIDANGTFGFTFTGNITYDPSGLLLNATSITLPAVQNVNATENTYLGNSNDFCTTVAGCASDGITPIDLPVSMSPLTVDLTGSSLPTLSFSSSSTSDSFTFTASSILVQTNSVAGTSFVNVYYTGLFNDTAGIYTPDEAASLSLTFTQTGGATGQVNGAGTFATPPEAPPAFSPEPATMTILGSALVGLGLIGRKKIASR